MKLVGVILCLISLCYAQPEATLEGDLMHFDPAIAMFCGKNNQHRSLTTGEWITDVDGDSNCLKTVKEVLDYCQKVYPSMEFTAVTEENNKVLVEHWCSIGHKGPVCKGHSHSVTPMKCVAPVTKQEGKIVPELKVPESVVDAAQPVKTEPLNEICSFPKVIGFCRAAFPAFYYDVDLAQCTRFIYGGCGGNENNFETMEDCVEKCGGTYDNVPKKGQKDPNVGQLFSNLGPVIFDNIDVDTTTESTTTTTTTESTPTSTTTSYFESEIDPINEHENYIESKMIEQQQHQTNLANAMSAYSSANINLGSNSTIDSKTIKKQRKLLKNEFDNTISLLTEKHNDKLAQLLAVHEAKMDSIQNQQASDELLNEQPIYIDGGGLPAQTDPDEIIENSEDEELDYYEEEISSNDEEDSTEIEEVEVDVEEDLEEDLEEDYDEDEDATEEDYDEETTEGALEEEINDEDDLEEEEEDYDDDDWLFEETTTPEIEIDFDADFNQQQPLAVVDTDKEYQDYSEASFTRWIAVSVGFLVLVTLVAVVVHGVNKRSVIRQKKFTKLQVNDHLTPEERQLLQMQQNGYENPTYKFFEKQQLV